MSIPTRSFSKFALILVLLIGSSLSLTASAAENTICEKNQLSSFWTNGLKAFKDNDWCKLPDQKIPAPLQKTINRLGALHQKAAKLLGTTASDLFGAPLVVKMDASPFGAFDSAAGKEEIILTVFPDWSGNTINESVYSHELGHVLTIDTSEALPQILRSMLGSPIFVEGFADVMARMITEKADFKEPQLPACFQIRTITDFQSYALPVGFFEYSFVEKRLQACCDHLNRRSLHDSRTKDACDFVAENLNSDGARDPLKRGRIDLKSENLHQLDEHQLGIPMHSFLQNLTEKTGKDAFQLFLKVIARADKLPGISTQIECRLEGAPATEQVFLPKKLVDLSLLFKSLRSEFSPAQQKTFDQLWTRHAMDTGMELSRGPAMKDSNREAGVTMLMAMKQNISPFYSSKNRCYSMLSALELDSPGCRVQCK